MTVAGVADGERQYFVEFFGAVITKEQQPGVDGSGDRCGEATGAGHEIETLLPEVVDRGSGRGWALAHEYPG